MGVSDSNLLGLDLGFKSFVWGGKLNAVIQIPPTTASLSIPDPRRCKAKTVSQQRSFCRYGDSSSFPQFQYYGEKPEVKHRRTLIEVVRGYQWDHLARHDTMAALTSNDESYERSNVGQKSLKRTDLVPDHESIGRMDMSPGHQSHNNVSVDTMHANAKKFNPDKEQSKPSRGSSSSWARLAGAERPLNSDEELSLSADVQDMLHLERQKDELGNKLGRAPTVEEWAVHSGTSICRLYARVGKGRAAKRKMIAANLPLVNSVAEQFCGRGLSHWELCQEGVQGLLKSTEKYDSSYNTKFSTYSFMWIWEKMSAGVKKFRHVLRMSRTVYETASNVLQHKEELQVLHGRPPSLQELASASHVDEDKHIEEEETVAHTLNLQIRNVMRLVRPVKSMDEQVSILEGNYEKQVEDQDLSCMPWRHIIESELRTEVSKALQCLTPREQRVLEMRYGLHGEPPQGRAQVGLVLDLTYESIRLIEKKALDNLRQFAKDDGLQQYLSEKLWS